MIFTQKKKKKTQIISHLNIHENPNTVPTSPQYYPSGEKTRESHISTLQSSSG